jgi:hypothetical protein
MNRINSKSIFTFLVISFVLVSHCSFSQEYKLDLVKRFYSLGTASINGTYYPLGTSITRLLNSKLENFVSIAEPTKGSVANIDYLRGSQIDMALVQSDVAFQAYNGENNFAERPFKNLRVMASLYSEVIQIVTLNDSGIHSIEDLKGKRVAIGNMGSGSAVSAEFIFNAAGITNDDYFPVYERFTKATESLKDGYIDAVFYIGGIPADGLTRLASKVEVRLVAIPETIQDKLLTIYPFFTREIIPSASYSRQAVEIPTMGLRALLIASENLEAKLAEDILKIIFSKEGVNFIRKDTGISLYLKDALKGIKFEMLHPGAKKFFAEKSQMP